MCSLSERQSVDLIQTDTTMAAMFYRGAINIFKEVILNSIYIAFTVRYQKKNASRKMYFWREFLTVDVGQRFAERKKKRKKVPLKHLANQQKHHCCGIYFQI